MHRGIALDAKKLWYRHRARGADPGQIIAQQVDNHQIFGALLGISA